MLSVEEKPMAMQNANNPKTDFDQAFIANERKYVEGLKILLQCFIRPIFKWADELETQMEVNAEINGHRFTPAPDIAPIDVEVIASNLEAIFTYHTKLLWALEHKCVSSASVMDELESKIPGSLDLHSVYIYNLDAAREKLAVIDSRQAVATFLRACQLQASSMTESIEYARLYDLLLLPTLCVMRFSFLPKAYKLPPSLPRVLHAAHRIHRELHKWARSDRFSGLQYRVSVQLSKFVESQPLVKQGTLMILLKTGPISCEFLLFKDAILFGYETKSSKRNSVYHVINQSIDLHRCYLVDDTDKLSKYSCSFMILSPNISFYITASDPIEKTTWVAAISGVIENLDLSDNYSYFEHFLKDNTAALNNDSLCNEECSEDPKICTVWMPDENIEVIQKHYVMPGTPPFYSDISAPVQLESILKDPRQLACFRRHVEESHCSENLVFWEMATEFKNKRYIGKRQAMIDAARAIVDRFVRVGSPDQVNISALMRSQVLQEVDSGNITIDCFEDCLREVIHMLGTDPFMHFLASPFFTEALQYRLEEPDPKLRKSGTIKFEDLVIADKQALQTISSIRKLSSEEPSNFQKPGHSSHYFPSEPDVNNDTQLSSVTKHKSNKTFRSMEMALKTAAQTHAWHPKNCVDSADWLRKISATAEMFPISIVICNTISAGLPMIFANDAFCTMTGYSKEEVVGLNCRFLQGPDTEPAATSLIHARLSKCEDVCVKITNYRKNGKKFQNLLCLKPVFDAIHVCRYIIGVQFEVIPNRYLKGRLNQLGRLIQMIPIKMSLATSIIPKPQTHTDIMTNGQLFHFSTTPKLGHLRTRSDEYCVLDHAIQEAIRTRVWDFKMGPNLDANQWLERFSKTMNQFPVSLVVSDMTRPGVPVIRVNQAFTKLTGYSAEEIFGRNCKFLQGKESEPEAIAHIRDKINKGEDCVTKITNYCKDGHKFENLICLKPVYDAHGVYHYTIGILFEIRSRMHLKKYLRQIEKLSSLLPTKVISTVQKRMMQQDESDWKFDLLLTAIGNAGDPPVEIQGDSQTKSIPWSISSLYRKNAKINEGISSPRVFNFDDELNRLKKIWGNPNILNPESWLNMFSLSIKHFPLSLSVSTMKEQGLPMVFVNESFCEMMGYSVAEAVGLNCRFLQGPETEPEAIALLRLKLGEAKDCHVKITNYRKNGEKFQNLLSIRIIRDADGVNCFAVGLQFELIADRTLETRLEQLNKFFKLLPKTVCKVVTAAKRKNHLYNLALGRLSEIDPEVTDKSLDSQNLPLGNRPRHVSSVNSYDLAAKWLEKTIEETADISLGVMIIGIVEFCTILYVNRTFCRMTGYTLEESKGKSCHFLQGPETDRESVAYVNQCLSKGKLCHVKLQNYKKNGEIFENLVTILPVSDGNQSFPYAISVMFEVRVDRELEGRIEWLDDFLQVLPKNMSSMERINTNVDLMLVAVGAYQDSEIMPLDDEEPISPSQGLSGLKGFQGDRTGCEADVWLARFTTMAEHFPACIVVSDMTLLDIPMVFVNQEFCRVTGYSKEEVVGRNCRFLQGPESEPDVIDTIREKLSKAQDCYVKLTNYRKNGEKFQNLLSMKPVFDVAGIYRYVIGVQFEIIPDQTLRTRLTGLERLLKLLPHQLRKGPEVKMNEYLTKRLMGQADNVLQSIGPLPAKDLD